MDARQEIERLRDHFHDLRKSVDATGVSVAVIQERQKSHSEQMDRIEQAVLGCNDLLRTQNSRIGTVEKEVAVLDTRTRALESTGAEAHASVRNVSAGVGAGAGGGVAAVVAWLWHWFTERAGP